MFRGFRGFIGVYRVRGFSRYESVARRGKRGGDVRMVSARLRVLNCDVQRSASQLRTTAPVHEGAAQLHRPTTTVFGV